MSKLLMSCIAFFFAFFTIAASTPHAKHAGKSASHEEKKTDHHHGAHGSHGLTLNNGKKWETDGPLRSGMNKIKAIVESKSPNAKQEVDKVVQGIIKNCKLSPKADAVLHVIIGDILRGPPAREKALHSYGEYFNHPGWQFNL